MANEEAIRLFEEGVALANQRRKAEAIPPLKRCIALLLLDAKADNAKADQERLCYALIRLAALLNDTGLKIEAADCAEQALALGAARSDVFGMAMETLIRQAGREIRGPSVLYGNKGPRERAKQDERVHAIEQVMQGGATVCTAQVLAEWLHDEPGSVSAMTNFAEAVMQSFGEGGDKYEEDAARSLANALTRAPRDPAVLRANAKWACIVREDHGAARRYARQLMDIRPNDPVAKRILDKVGGGGCTGVLLLGVVVVSGLIALTLW